MKRNVERKKKYEKKMKKTGNKKCCSETTRPRDFVEFEMKNAHGKDGDGTSEVFIMFAEERRTNLWCGYMRDQEHSSQIFRV